MDAPPGLFSCWDPFSGLVGTLCTSAYKAGESLLSRVLESGARQVTVGDYQLRLCGLIAEGGYSQVLLAKLVRFAGPVAEGADPPAREYAVKRVLCQSDEQAEDARREIDVLRRAGERSACAIELIAAAEVPPFPDEARVGVARVVYMVFPLYAEGSLADLVGAMRSRREWMAPIDVVDLLLQVADALLALHSQDPPLAHCDVKPLNVLVQRRDASSSTGPQFKPTSVTSSPPSLVEAEGRHRGNGVACAAHEGDGEDGEWAAFGDEWRRERAHLVERAGGSGREWSGGSGARHRARARRHNGTGGDADREVEMAELGIASMDNGVTAGASSGVHYRAVLVDFGSCCEARRTVRDFHTMMVVKEQAEAHSTAPYRAPELFEPPMPGSVDERVDVWSLGATAYFAMFGEGPFDYALREGGGSIALAVLSGRMRWPEGPGPAPPEYSGALRSLVEMCMQPQQQRPGIKEVMAKAREMRANMAGVGDEG